MFSPLSLSKIRKISVVVALISAPLVVNIASEARAAVNAKEIVVSGGFGGGCASFSAAYSFNGSTWTGTPNFLPGDHYKVTNSCAGPITLKTPASGVLNGVKWYTAATTNVGDEIANASSLAVNGIAYLYFPPLMSVNVNAGGNLTQLITETSGRPITVSTPPAVTITSMSPTNGPAIGGTAITITGSGFASGPAVTVGGSNCRTIVVVSATSITCTTPSGTAGAQNVVVTNTDATTATATNAFTYNAGPTISGVSPTSGVSTGGTQITISGSNFTHTGSAGGSVPNGLTVTVGGQPCVSLGQGISYGNELVCSVPAGTAGVADIVVTNPDTQTITATGIFTYSLPPAPTVSGVSPTSGTSAGATSITITGTNFVAGSTVTVGGSPCTGVTVVSATSITCTTPSGTAGTSSVIVTSASQSNAANTLFTFVAAATTTTTTPAATPTTTTPVATSVTTTTVKTATTTTTIAAQLVSSISGPTLVNASNQVVLAQKPGSATAIVNGQSTAVKVDTAANLKAAQVVPEERSPVQVKALQDVASGIVEQINQAAGGNSGLIVQKTTTGAAVTGLLNVSVPIENTVLVEVGSRSTLFAALNQDGSVTEVKPGALIEVLGKGEVGVVASGLTPGEKIELVVMSTPTLIGSYTVAANGTIKTQAKLPTSIGLGNHTLVLASPTVQSSLGMKVIPKADALPATGLDTDTPLRSALWMIAVGSLLVYLRRRRNLLA